MNIFLSHAASDRALALEIKKILEGIFSGMKIFCSSDPTTLPLGMRWPADIQQALASADVLLLLATSRSLTRPWVWFECGTFWFSDRRLIPICSGNIHKGNLPNPLSERTGLNLYDESGIEELISTLESVTKIDPQAFDSSSIVEKLKQKEDEAHEELLREDEGWRGARWADRFLAYDGPLERLTLLPDNRPFDNTMADALKEAGFIATLSLEQKLSQHTGKGRRQVFLTDRVSWRQKITHRELILVAAPADVTGKN